MSVTRVIKKFFAVTYHNCMTWEKNGHSGVSRNDLSLNNGCNAEKGTCRYEDMQIYTHEITDEVS